jgi:hypothetical protein
MSRKSYDLVPAIMLLAATIFPASLVSAQAVSLQEQLAAQYKLVKMGSDTSGYAVVEAGTLLAIKKGGVLGVPYSDKTLLTTKYEGGTVHTPSGLMVQGRKALFGHFSQTQSEGQTTHLFAVGDKIYPTKIEVNLAKDDVVIGIVACDTCNKTDPPTYNKAQVQFQFPVGALAKASAGEVEDVIGQLLAVSDDAQGGNGNGNDQGNNQGNNNDQQGNNQQAGGDQGGGGGGQAQAQQTPPAEPQQIEKGQTPDQVIAAIGQPDKKINLGAKQIYVYKDIKVTFLNGKVSDVQ